MQNSLKNDVKYLNNLDLVRIWDLFQESACCLKDLYTDTNYGHRNVKNFVKTIKSLDNFYKGTVDVLIKKRERYTDIGFERERLKLLQWYLVKGKNETFDKKKLLRHVYRKRLKTDKNLKYRRIGYLYGDNFPPEHGDSRVTISNYGIYGGESVAGYLPPNRALQLDSRMKRDVGVFNDAVNLKTLQGDLSDFELGDTQPFMYPDMGASGSGACHRQEHRQSQLGIGVASDSHGTHRDLSSYLLTRTALHLDYLTVCVGNRHLRTVTNRL